LRDRITTANILDDALKNIIKKEEERKNSIVLGIPRGGTIMADIIGKKVSYPVSLILLFQEIFVPRTTKKLQ
jgi:putative phosphoribosyl transferase